MKNTQNLITQFIGHFLQKEGFTNIKSGRRYHSQKSENKRLKREAQQLRKLVKLNRNPSRRLRLQ